MKLGQKFLFVAILFVSSLYAGEASKVLQEKYTGGGKLLSDLDWSQTPASSSYIDSFEITANTGDNYGARLTAEVTIPTTGVYEFYIASDDSGDLKLSLDNTEASLITIASVNGWCNFQQWNKFATQKSNTYNLTAGQKILLSARVKEQSGGDNLSIGWSLNSAAIVVIPGSACEAPAVGPVTPAETITPLEAVVLYEKWNNTTGSLQDFDFTTTPSESQNLIEFDAPINVDDNYMSRMTAVVKIPKSGEYIFYISSDDQSELYIDSVKAAEVTSNVTSKSWTNSPSQKSITYNFVAGQSVSIKIIHREGTGSDHSNIGWSFNGGNIDIVLGKFDEWLTDDKLEINTPITSITSPAWVEGRVGAIANTVTYSIDGGASLSANLMGDTRFYANNSSSALGITLNPTATTALSVTNGNNTINQSITWTPTDIVITDSVVIRKGDSLLLTGTGTGAVLTIDPDFDSTGFVAAHTGVPNDNFIQQFNTAGSFIVEAEIDGVSVGNLLVFVADLSFDGPIACEINYNREKVVILTGVSADVISFTSSYNENLDINFKEWSSAGLIINIEPLNTGNDSVIARIGGSNGPAIAVQEIDDFDLTTQAINYIGVIDVFADGSQLIKTNLIMIPKITGLQVDLHIFVSGVTHEDGTLDKTIMTDDFDNSSPALYEYRMIKNLGVTTGACHTIKIYQNNVQIGD